MTCTGTHSSLHVIYYIILLLGEKLLKQPAADSYSRDFHGSWKMVGRGEVRFGQKVNLEEPPLFTVVRKENSINASPQEFFFGGEVKLKAVSKQLRAELTN